MDLKWAAKYKPFLKDQISRRGLLVDDEYGLWVVWISRSTSALTAAPNASITIQVVIDNGYEARSRRTWAR